jgi:hypothetical protein
MLAVKTGIWPLKEYADGRIVHTKPPRERAPTEEYLKLQGRFAHLFRPARNESLLAEIQARVDAYELAYQPEGVYDEDAVGEFTTIPWEKHSSRLDRALRIPSQRLWKRSPRP